MLFIFDWDGTLADSREQIVESMQATIDGLNWPEERQQCADMIGLGLQQTAEALIPLWTRRIIKPLPPIIQPITPV